MNLLLVTPRFHRPHVYVSMTILKQSQSRFWAMVKAVTAVLKVQIV